MTSQDLYDLAPLARVLLTGAVIALGPIVWIWWRHRGATPLKRLQVLAVLTLFLSFDLVMFGAFTRLTDSGLGCPDWPGCYGSASPIGARADIAAAQEAMPTGPVTHGKAWVEAFRPKGAEKPRQCTPWMGGGHGVSGRAMYWFAKIATGLAHRALSA